MSKSTEVKEDNIPENKTFKCICCDNKYVTSVPRKQYYCLSCIVSKEDNLRLE